MLNQRRLAPALRPWGIPALCLVLAADFSTAGGTQQDDPQPDVTITVVGVPGNVFGGQETEFRFQASARKDVKGRVAWRLAAGTATVTAGEADLTATPAAAATVTIRVAVPPQKAGAVLQTRLTVSVLETGQPKPAATLERDVWVFPTDPFAGRAGWLKKLKLNLYDPPGATGKVLTAAGVPFEEVRTLDALAGLKDGVLVVGEGVSFRDERGLAAALEKLAATGLTVLCLAPADGDLVIPGVGGPAGALRDLSFSREIVRTLDKRLDPDG